eukprot:6194922-Pleurochrysis_carterae.AAC.3
MQEAQAVGLDCARLAGASAAREGRLLIRAAPAWRRWCMQRAASSADMTCIWEEARAECIARTRGLCMKRPLDHTLRATVQTAIAQKRKQSARTVGGGRQHDGTYAGEAAVSAGCGPLTTVPLRATNPALWARSVLR